MSEQLTPAEKARLEAFAAYEALKCPRCGEHTLHQRPAMNSVSRVDSKTYICGKCGTAEAMEDHLNPGQDMTKDGWAVQ